MNAEPDKSRVLILIVSYKAEKYITSVLERIPRTVWSNPRFDAEVLVIDDESGDQTFHRAREFAIRRGNPKITVLHNPKNQGYGGNQKIGYTYALKMNFDVVILLHGDGQYPPEYLEPMVLPLLDGQADAVFGSRMTDKRAALQGGMPLYKWIGNQILTSLQNRILKSHLAEFHTGYRAYRVDVLRSIPFEFNSNYFDFDTDIIIQLLDTHKKILEIPIPTFYGDEISRVNGFKYGALILKTSILSRLMRWGIFYDPKFDYLSENTQYISKFGFDSSHQFALDRITGGSTVLDLGSGPGIMAVELAKKDIRTISVDQYISPLVQEHSWQTIQTDLDLFSFDSCPKDVDTVLMLDIIEHLRNPEGILKKIRDCYCHEDVQIILTTGNVAFLPVRLALLFGQFNYGKRGILDLDHKRLFTFHSLRRSLNQVGFEILEEKGIPAPFFLALGDVPSAHFLVALNRFLIKISKTLFSYQIAVLITPTPILDVLLDRAVQSGQELARDVAKSTPEIQ